MNQKFNPQDLYPKPDKQNQSDENDIASAPTSSSDPMPVKNGSSSRLIFGFGGLIGLLIVVGIIMWVSKTQLQTYTSSDGPINQAEDARIKSDIIQIKSEIQIYFQEKQSYLDYTPSESVKNDLIDAGSELNTASLSDKTYMIYAYLPASKKYFCIDSNNLNIELDSIDTSKNLCR